MICDNIPTKAILFSLAARRRNSTWLITSERARKVLFTCVLCTNQLLLQIVLIGKSNCVVLLAIIGQWGKGYRASKFANEAGWILYFM